MIKSIMIEICCGTVDDCLVAINNNVDRIELNSALELGGLTPSLATLRTIKEITSIPLCCMVRPRTAGFYYSEIAYQTMLEDARILLENKADGIVFGFLNPDNTVDIGRTKEMCELIHSFDKEAIFHKAFDSCPNLNQASLDLISCGVSRILTDGGKAYPNIEAGAFKLKELNELYGDKITYLPGGGVTAENISNILTTSGCTQIHMTAKQLYLDQHEYVAVDDSTLKRFLSQI